MHKNKLLTVAEKFSRKDLESSSKRKEFAQEVRATVQELLQSNNQQKILEDLGKIYGLLPFNNDAKWILGTIISGLHNAGMKEDGSTGTINPNAVLNDSFYDGQGNEELTETYNQWKSKPVQEVSNTDDNSSETFQERKDRHERIHQKKPENAKEEKKSSGWDRQKEKFSNRKNRRKHNHTNDGTQLEDSNKRIGEIREFPASNHQDYMPK